MGRDSSTDSLVAFIESESRPAFARGEITDHDFRSTTMCLAGAFNASAYEWITREERLANDVLDEARQARTRPACGVALAAGQEPAVRRFGCLRGE